VANFIPGRHFIILRDITEHKHLEAQFLQAQKMEAIGRLAGGIAHDFNNMLTVIEGYSALLLENLHLQDPRRRAIEEIKKAAERSSALTRQLLAFSRKQTLQPVLLDLNATVTEMSNMLHRLVGEDIAVLTQLAPALEPVKVDPGQIEQIIMNLAVNARDAMPDGGTLMIETANVAFDERSRPLHPEIPPGSYVLLAVSDTGQGMDEAIKAHLFEPFFTTKEPGKGTGLGLASVYGIIKQSGGYISVYSEIGHGTTFNIYLPQTAAEAPVSPPSLLTAERLQGTETVLLVEDEATVRELISHVLEMDGYTVLEVSQGDEAVALGAQYPGIIHLLMTDVVMPGMSGPQLARRLIEVRPELKVLYLSGYIEHPLIQRGVLEPSVAFLQKPFTLLSLTQKVREVLNPRDDR
jgi:nitrogen-specific signal transduction histidine kinase